MQPTSPSNIISQQQYDQQSAAWAAFINERPASLLGMFTASGERIATMTLPMQQLTQLLSTVGVSQVKARFLLVSGGSEPAFGLALYAVDEQGTRRSAYYTTDVAPAASAPDSNPGVPVGQQIPNDLAADWLNNWAATPNITPDMFMHTGSPLLGYNFKVSDFVNPLFMAQPLADKSLCLDFGLHTYYAAAAGEERSPLINTFGLLVRIADSNKDAARVGVSNTAYYDMATPCPPNA